MPALNIPPASDQPARTVGARHAVPLQTLGAIALLALLFGQVLNGSRDASPTVDEPVHIARGYALWRTGDFRLQGGHPPLIHLISGTALLLEPDLPPPQSLPGWDQADRLTLAAQFLQGSKEHIDRIVWLARYPIALLALLLGAVVFRWAREWRGPAAGLLALAFLAFDPNIVAHAGLMTTDIGVSLFFFAATYSFAQAIQRPTVARLAMAGVLFGLAQAAKLSALILGPAFVLIALLHAARLSTGSGNGWSGFIRSIRPRNLSITVSPLLVALIVFIVGGLTLWAVYGFQWGLTPPAPGLSQVLGGLSLPAPAYWASLLRLREHADLGHQAYLMGQISSRGWWYYFPLAFLVKTPLPTLIALLLATGWLLRSAFSGQGSGVRRAAMDAALLIPPLAYLAASVKGDLNIGYRHVLPVLPFVFVFIAQPLVALSRAVDTKRRALKWLLPTAYSLLLLWLAMEAIAIQPYPLAYFNELAGGPAQGYRFLVDSNLDWGQDLKRLATTLKAQGIERPWLSYFGSVDPAIYGIQYQRLPMPSPSQPAPDYHAFHPAAGIYAISVSNLMGVKLDEPDIFDVFRRRQPLARIGYSIFLYRVEAAPPEGDWVGACYAPDRPYDDDAIRQAFGLPNLRIAQFDCRSGWLYANGGRPGWYLIPVDTEGPTLAGRFLDEASGAEVAFRSRRTATHPPFTLYYWPGGTGLPATPADPPANFEGALTFLGYRLERDQVAPGETIHVETVWQVTGTGLGPVSIFAHLIAPDEHLAGTGDGLGVPPDSWAVGDVLVQTHALTVPADATPGLYWLQTGVYSVIDGRRFSIREGSPLGADRLRFAQVHIK